MNVDEFEKLIISFVQGNSNPNFTDVIDQMLHQEENLFDFVNSLFNLLFITSNEIALKSSMILISSLLSKFWSSDLFEENWIQETIKKLISFYHNNDFLVHESIHDKAIKNNNGVIDNEKLYLFSQVVGTIAQNIQQYYIYDKFVNEYNENSNEKSNYSENLQYLKDLTFQISSIYSFYNNINFSKIGIHYQIILDILKRALQSHEKNFENAIKSIYILAYLLDFSPDEKEVVNDHIEIIIYLANNSDKLPLDLFMNLWKSICSFLYSVACSNDINLVTQFHPSVFKICSLDTIPSDYKIYSLRSIWSCAADYDRPVVHQIINLTCEIASEYVAQSNSLPFDFLFIFESCFHDFEHDMIYQYTRQIIISYLNSEKYSDHIVGLCLLRCMVLNLPHEVFHDADFIIGEVEKGLKSNDDLMIIISSIIISSCVVPISSNLIDVDSLMPQFVPLLIHANPDVRYHATEACETLLSYSRPQISIPGISFIVFNLITKVPMQDISRFLKFLSKCIRHDIKLGTELAIHFANFTLSMLSVDSNTEVNRSMIGGSCYVSISLMSMDENTHEILLPRTIEIISNTIQSTEKIVKCFGIAMLNKLMKIFPKESSQLFNAYGGLIEEILESDNDDSLVRRKGIINLSSLISLNGDGSHPFIPKIIEIAKNWLNSGHHSLIGCGVEALKKLQCRPILPKEVIVEIFQCLTHVLVQTNSYDVACYCANAMAFCVSHCTASPDAHDEIANIGYQVGLTYINGEMLVLKGVSPVGTDLEFNLLYSMTMLVCELFSTPCDIMRFFFPFIESIIHRNNNLNTEVMMICLVSAIKNNALIEEEIVKTKNFVLSFFINDIPKELMCTEVELITIMFDKGLFSLDELNIDDRLMTLKNWWEICMDPSERSKMKAASSEITVLLLKLAFHFEIKTKIEDLIIDTFKQFPPEIFSFIPEMISIGKKCIESDTNAPEVIILKLTKGILKLITLSKMNLKKRGIDDELFNTCKSILLICLSRSQKVQLMINNFANKSEIRKSILQEFIH